MEIYYISGDVDDVDDNIGSGAAHKFELLIRTFEKPKSRNNQTLGKLVETSKFGEFGQSGSLG